MWLWREGGGGWAPLPPGKEEEGSDPVLLLRLRGRGWTEQAGVGWVWGCMSLRRARRVELEGDKWKNFLSAMVEKALGILSEKAEACL